MGKVEKISEEQYVLDCINKEFELCGSEKRFDTFMDLSNYSKENPQWFDECEFSGEGTYNTWLEYCKQHTYDWLPKRTTKASVENHVSYFALQYGFPCRYDRDETGNEEKTEQED